MLLTFAVIVAGAVSASSDIGDDVNVTSDVQDDSVVEEVNDMAVEVDNSDLETLNDTDCKNPEITESDLNVSDWEDDKNTHGKDTSSSIKNPKIDRPVVCNVVQVKNDDIFNGGGYGDLILGEIFIIDVLLRVFAPLV